MSMPPRELAYEAAPESESDRLKLTTTHKAYGVYGVKPANR